MKTKLLAVMAALTLVASAEAANTTKKKVAKKAKTPVTAPAAATKVVPTTAPATAAPQSNAAPAATDAVKTSAAAPVPSSEAQTQAAAAVEGPKSPWSLIYFSYTDSPTFTYEKAKYKWASKHYLGAGYKFDSGWKLSLTGRLDTDYTNKTAAAGDPYIAAGSPGAEIAGLNVSFKPRMYLPFTRKAGSSAGTFQPRVYADASGNGFDFLGIAVPSFEIPGPNAAGDGNTAGMTVSMNGSYNFTSNFSADVSLNPGMQAKRNGTVEWDSSTDIGVSFKLRDNLKISPYVEFQLGDPTNAESSNFHTYVEWAIL